MSDVNALFIDPSTEEEGVAAWENIDSGTDLADIFLRYFPEMVPPPSEKSGEFDSADDGRGPAAVMVISPRSRTKETPQGDFIEADKIVSVETPFQNYAKNRGDRDSDPSSPFDRNYLGYQLFAFKSRVSLELSRQGDLIPLFKPVEEIPRRRRLSPVSRSLSPPFHGKTEKIHLQLEKDGELVKWDPQIQESIEIIADRSLNHLPEYAVLLSSHKDIVYAGCCLGSGWLHNILSALSLEQMSGFSLPYRYEEQRLIVRFDPHSEYAALHEYLQRRVLATLAALFKEGALALDPRVDGSLISRWRLSALPGTDVYLPTWKNSWIARSPADFMLKRYQGDDVLSFKIGRNVTQRHHISRALGENGFEHLFSDDRVLISIEDYRTAVRAHHIIFESRYQASGRVAVSLAPLTSSETIKYREISLGVVYSALLKDISAAETEVIPLLEGYTRSVSEASLVY